MKIESNHKFLLTEESIETSMCSTTPSSKYPDFIQKPHESLFQSNLILLLDRTQFIMDIGILAFECHERKRDSIKCLAIHLREVFEIYVRLLEECLGLGEVK